MALEKRGFCGSWPNYRTPCTSSEGRLCNIFQDLPLWNEFFWPVGFELRELSPGQLSLVQVPDACVPSDSAKEEKEAAKILRRLLTHHHCVVSVDLDGELFKRHHQMICGALRECVSLRKLKLCMPSYATKASLMFVAKLPKFNQVRELVLCRVPLDTRSVEGLSGFLASTRSLTALNIAHQDMGYQDAVVIFQGLKQNVTIATLSLDINLLREASPQCGMFSDYLRTNKTLRTLSVTSLFRGASSYLLQITEPLYHNTTLCELNLIGLNLDLQNYKLITDMLRKNWTLRRFHMVDCFHGDYSTDTNPGVRAFRDGSSPFPMWLVALAQNEALEELTLDLSWIGPDDCDSLVKALARHVSLKRVTVQTIRDNCVAQICRAIRDTGVTERFFVTEQQVLEDSVVELPECSELSSVSVDYTHSTREFELLHNALRLLPQCNQVKSLRLRMREAMFEGSVSSLIVAYISNTTALRELDLILIPKPWISVERPQRTLLQALSNNKGLRRLSLRGIQFDETEAEMLADMLHSSRTLFHLSFLPGDDESMLLLMRKLSTNMHSNFTLLRIHVGMFDAGCIGDKFVVDDVLRRNDTLVMRAAHFVMGMRHKYCAAAAELVQLNPGLVMKVQELASVDEDQAVSRIKSALKSIVELDDFMCLAGVVKETVSCHRRDDGQKQLTDLNFDCWLHVRQYLKADDILNSK